MCFADGGRKVWVWFQLDGQLIQALPTMVFWCPYSLRTVLLRSRPVASRWAKESTPKWCRSMSSLYKLYVPNLMNQKVPLMGILKRKLTESWLRLVTVFILLLWFTDVCPHAWYSSFNGVGTSFARLGNSQQWEFRWKCDVRALLLCDCESLQYAFGMRFYFSRVTKTVKRQWFSLCFTETTTYKSSLLFVGANRALP